jgi:hypothetical protein
MSELGQFDKEPLAETVMRRREKKYFHRHSVRVAATAQNPGLKLHLMMFTVVHVESTGEAAVGLAPNARLLKFLPRASARVMRRKCCLRALKNLPVLKCFYRGYFTTNASRAM